MALKVVNIEDYVSEYDKLRSEKKVIEERMKFLAQEIKDYSIANGEKDSKGSFYCENDSFTFGAMAKTSVKINADDFVKFLNKKGKNFKDCYVAKTTYSINDDKVEEHINNGDLSKKEVESFVNVSTSYSVACLVKEEMPEIEQNKLVASRKGKRK